ncbi:hypothetical protein [Niallia sp. Krafla_26]|uniref:hypothetical protein n=1 Tax=Niallia sp. Krafla_26 TaxID=3064703 RepID=UPI003D182695
MQLNNVKPHLETIVHYFDFQHHFFTKVEVHFNHHKQQLRAILLFPYQQRGQFILDKIEAFYNDQWISKRGNSDLYGMTLTNHMAIIWLGQHVHSIERQAKEELDQHFHQIVHTLANRIENEISTYYPVHCEVAPNSLSILTTFQLNGEEYEGIIETNFHFATNLDDENTIQEQLNHYKTQIISNIEKIKLLHTDQGGSQNMYLTTIPVPNPVSTEKYEDYLLNVCAKGFCDYCQQNVFQPIKTNIKINHSHLNKHQLELLITVRGDQFICEHCHNMVSIEKIVIKNKMNDKIFAERALEELDLLGNSNNQESHKKMILEAIEHKDYFYEHREAFWNAFCYIASQRWETFINELTKVELEYVLPQFLPDLPLLATKEELISHVNKLNDTQKSTFWRIVNEQLIDYYLNITIFGWDVKKEREIIGENRADFIFKYLPIPEKLKRIHQKRINLLYESSENNLRALKKKIETQKQVLQLVQQQNGRLTQKLGEANLQIMNLEQTSYTHTTERNPTDIIKIQQLKGLIEELKAEITHLSSKVEDDTRKKKETIILTEESPQHHDDHAEVDLLSGKKIFIIGGYRSKQTRAEESFTLWTHEARHLDPDFYHYLNEADILIVLIRYISHHAMWEAKEFAILKQKPIFYSTFTNIPTILKEIKRELLNKKEKK